ncbi:IclR family transcriptional regulator [Streptomyces pratens]|uniref:IclR family transcriptional regulator n=1 Tax=Streptomyces pratens TaxID=887456 RepID=A0ABW1MAQ5_9ACTN
MKGTTEPRGRTPGVDSARRALKILLLFSEERPGLSVEEIAQEVDISIPSAYRFLSLLREMELVEDNGDGTCSLSPRILLLARSAEKSLQIGKPLRPLIERLTRATGEAALVIQRVGDYATCVEICQTDNLIRLSFTPGQIMSLYRGAGPKVLLAAMGESWALRCFERLNPFPPQQEREAFLAEIAAITAQGWSKSAAEVDEGVWAVAAPIKIADKVVAALSVAGPQFRIDEQRADHILKEVLSSAAEASRTLTNRAG